MLFFKVTHIILGNKDTFNVCFLRVGRFGSLPFAIPLKNKKRQSANVRAIVEDGVLCSLSDDENVLGKNRCPPKVAVNVTVQMRNCRGKIVYA